MWRLTRGLSSVTMRDVGVGRAGQWCRVRGCAVDSTDDWDENGDAGHVSGASSSCAVDSRRVLVGIGSVVAAPVAWP